MGLMDGKKGLVFGVANDHSIAWAIAEALHREGASLGFTHLPDKDPTNPKMERRVRKLVDPIGAKMLVPCNVQNDDDLDRTFAAAKETFGSLDFVVHSIAYAPIEDLKVPVYGVSREGFKVSMEISAYSLLAICRRSRPLMPQGGSIISLTYLGGEKVIPGYNLMGLCKAALESAVAYLAHELGPEKIRVNALSAGPIRTLSSSAVKGIDMMLSAYDRMAPLRRNVEPAEVAQSALYLLSDLSSGVTGETLHVDSGFHVMGAPPIEAAP
uniref:Enoyl-[acyl-carrier-protein] reductase [NADH] n=1 Tax=Schlesneria paludicola TaxID=360056 RepID=A0A7C4QMW3_9PLAN